MQINLERRSIVSLEDGSFRDGRFVSADMALAMRNSLSRFVSDLLENTAKVILPSVTKMVESRGEGHLHLAPEVFFQTCGSSRFTFPHEELDLQPGQVLIVPPRLLHKERVIPDAQGAAFSNVVIYADGTALTCHLALESESGKPDIHHLEALHHAHASQIHGWLSIAARLGRDANTLPFAEGSQADERLGDIQLRGLIAVACAGVLRVLDDSSNSTTPEPALVARTRVWVQHRIGDHELSVSWLAEKAGCTPEYLSHLFNHATGEHLVAYINRQRMQRAASLLTETKMAGKEVAWVCGFSTPSYFIQMFRTYYGLTPKNWRTKHNDEMEDI